MAAEMQRLRAAGDHAPRHLRDWIYRVRFNLLPEDVALLPESRPPDAWEPPDTAATQWGMYCRFLFTPCTFYAFRRLRPGRFLYVSETKSVPNRAPPPPDECIGRPLVLAWFEAVEEVANGVHVTPCDVLGRAG